MRLRRPAVPVIAGLLIAAAWTLSGPIFVVAASNVYVTRVLSVIGISPLPARFWSWPDAWAFLALAASAFLMCAVAVVVMRFVVPARRGVVVVWFAAVVAGAVLGWAIDSLSVLTSIDDFGWRSLTMAGVEAGTRGAYWGLVQGWIPALIVRGMLRGDVSTDRDPVRAPLLFAAGALVVFLVIGTLGTNAWQAAIAAENAAVESIDESAGAAPDPAADGTAPATVAPGADVPDLPSDACTPDRAMLLLGTSDAALGHRSQRIRLMNFSDAPCIIEGYLDIAVADQNGHELPVDITHGSSYMATDPGTSTITIPAQGEAFAVISWDANSTHGALVARALHVAVLPGFERGSWPVELDIIEGTDIELTAWQLDETPAGS